MTLTQSAFPPSRSVSSHAPFALTLPAEADAVRRTTAHSVLIVEDEADIASLICYNLGREGYRCECVSAGDAALERIRSQPPDLVLLDRMLPGLSGDEVVRILKADPRTAPIPVVVLTAKTEEVDQLAGFALGAEDYVTKPFSIKVLLARVGAVLRRGKDRHDDAAELEVLTAGAVQLFPSRHEVTVTGSAVSLTAAEFRLLKALMAARGRVLARTQLLDAVSGSLAAVTDRTIDVHITALRRKLGQAATWIQTVRGVGYTVRPPPPAPAPPAPP